MFSFMFAQQVDKKQMELKKAYKKHKQKIQKTRSTKDAVWSEDFAGGLPDGWSIVDLSSQGMPWEWTDGPVIGCYTDVQPEDLISTSPENGYMFICPDGFNSVPQYTNVEDGAVISPNLITMDSYIESGPIDLSAATNGAILEFYQWARVYTTFSSEIWVSNDYDPANPDVAHWSVFSTHELPAENMDVEEFHQINISTVAAGQSEVYIRIYAYGATHYYWIVDDFQVFEPYTDNLQVNNSWLFYDWIEEIPEEAPAAVGGYLQHGGAYYKIPLDHVQEFVGAQVVPENFGMNDQTNVVLTTTIYHKSDSAANDSTQVFTHVSDPFEYAAFYSDTIRDLFEEESYTPDAWGHYEVYMTISMDNTDEFPDDNRVHFDFEVSDSTYSRTTDNITDSRSTALIIGGGLDGDGLGQYYRLVKPLTEVESFRFYFAARNRDFADLINNGTYTALAKIYSYNEEEEDWQLAPLVSSDIYTVTMNDTGTFITIPYIKDGTNEFLPAGDYCVLLETYTGVDQGENEDIYFWIGCDNDVKQPDYVNYNLLNGDWGWMPNANYTFNLIHKAEDWDTSTTITDPVAVDYKALQLGQNFPNPAINKTEIKYVISDMADVSLSVFDLTGKRIEFIEKGLNHPGRHSINIDVAHLKAGVYYYTLKAGEATQTRKMIVMD